MGKSKKYKILIVEDNQENIDLLHYFLSPQGYDIAAVTDGPEAIQSIETEKPDIILLDIMLPTMNGYQVCERLKKDNRTKYIPIICTRVEPTERIIPICLICWFMIAEIVLITSPPLSRTAIIPIICKMSKKPFIWLCAQCSPGSDPMPGI